MVRIRDQRRRGAVACTVLAAAFAVAPLVTTHGEAHAAANAGEAQVICLVEWGSQPTGAYRGRPHSCDLHIRGQVPVAHVNVAVTKRLQWLHWGGRTAVAKGRLGISTYGLAPLKLRLSGLREICGQMVYTKAQLFVTTRYGGEIHHSRNSMPLDTCLH